jgi:predicted TIM-barrel fold metal-dependent hydrolase
MFPTVISADSHVMEPTDLWLKTLSNKLGDRTPRLLDEYQGKKGRFFYTGGQVLIYGQGDADAQKIGMQEAGWRPDVRVEFQKKAGVAVEIMNATTMLLIMRHPDREACELSAQVFNDWLADYVAYDRKRFLGVSMIPMFDVEWALKELERTGKKGLACANVHLVPPPGLPPYRKPYWDKFWARCEEMDVPVQLHIITGRIPDPLHYHTDEERETSPSTLIALGSEVMPVLADDFIYGGILDRFPKLKVLCTEFEISWIPYFMWRLDQMQQAMAARLPLRKLEMRASDYMRRRVWHGMIDDKYGAEAIPHIGASQVLWGSDFPHIRSIGLDTQSALARMLAKLPPADQEKVVGGNAKQLFNIA